MKYPLLVMVVCSYIASSYHVWGFNYFKCKPQFFIESPIITSIVPNYPRVFGSLSNYMVPARFENTVLTCNVFGWPPPTVKWLSLSPSINISSQTRSSNAFSSTTLQFLGGFKPTDIGMYYCQVQATDTNLSQSLPVNLTQASTDTTSVTIKPLWIDSPTAQFQLRVLTTDCSTWNETLRQQIARDFSDVLTSGVISQCPNCSADVVITQGPACSEQKDGAAVFHGAIRNEERNLTEIAVHALKTWLTFEPFVTINDVFQLVDQDCLIQVEFTDTEECSNEVGFPYAIAFSIAGVFILIILVLISLNIYMIFVVRKR